MGKLPIEPEEANLSKQRSGPLQPKLDDFKLACFPGNLTFYVAGRLLQRLSWYWQQSYLLSGPICQTTDLQALGLSQVITNHYLDRVRKEKVGFLKDSTTLANNCFNLITSLVNYLPVNADQVLRMQKLLATIWRQADEGEGSFALSQFYRQGTSAWRRAVASDYAEKMSEEHVRPFVDQMQIVLLEGSGDIQRNLFLAGKALELGQCPDHVVRFLDDPTKLGSWAWRSAGLAKEGQTLDKGNDTDADIEIVWSEEMIISFIRESSLACVAIPVGALIPNDSWWTEFQLAFEQIDCSVDRSETIRNLGRELRDDHLFDLLSLANQAAIERFSSSSASVGNPHEQTAIIYQDLGLRLATGNKLTRDSRIEYATIPWGKARTYLAALLHAGNRGATWQDFEPDLSPNPDEIERTDRNRVERVVHKLRKCVVKVDVQITFNRETKRYVLVDAAAAGAAPADF